jgi:S-adenosylmethionine:diacylglycerol 3-amino-3-carboxypropyl transferase
MRDNPIQFAVVREDPLIEALLVEKFKLSSLLMVCSGGCSVLSLKTLFPHLTVSAFDVNPAQIDLTKEKAKQLNQVSDLKKNFNIENADPLGLNQCGNFESLFRGLREFIFDFILDKPRMEALFFENHLKDYSLLTEHRYWPIAFSLYFSNALLKTMFGEAAIQHAPRDSYPRYFQTVFEKGLKKSNGFKNYFLHHVFLGYYQDHPESLPVYLRSPQKIDKINFIHGPIEAVNDLRDYALIQLSNIMDWMSEAENTKLGSYITENTTKGTLVLIRQLNNEQPVQRYFPDFTVDESLSDYLYSIDRSLFYSSILCLKRR